MREQVINEHYINLEYNKSSKEKALMEISILSKKIKFKNVDDFSTRFLETASIIEKNVSLFKSVCEHIDTITIILEYLTNFGVKFMFGNECDEEYNEEEIILSVVFTLFNICREHQVQLFLENAIIKNSTLYEIQYDRLKNELLNQTNEMILLADSDLYAVISYLTRIGYSHINKIWIQISIKQKFLTLIKKYFRHKDFTIRIFRSTKEFAPRTSYSMNITSIWSEDIVGAKDLTTFLDRDVVFINMHMDLYGGIMLLPYVKVFDKIIHERFKLNLDNPIQPSINEVKFSQSPDMESMSIYNLFYDGKWHKPIKDTYWKHNNSLRANATGDDIKMCFNSAMEGFKSWKALSINKRKQFLSKLATTLIYNGKFLLGDIVSRWTAFPLFNETSLVCSQNDRLEIIKHRIPRGVIILKEKTEEILFLRLIQILISGNSVIVIADANSCSLAPYCDIFSTSNIPRGVINFLSNENTSDLELSLCATDYANYEKQFFNLEKIYINLYTLPKQVVFSLK